MVASCSWAPAVSGSSRRLRDARVDASSRGAAAAVDARQESVDAPLVSSPNLASYGGVAAPADLAADLARLDGLPAAARDRFWDVVAPTLVADPVPREVERKIDVFCAEHRLDPEDLAKALRACRSLLRGAAKHAVGAVGFQSDLKALGAPESVTALLGGRFESAMLRLRKQLVVDEIGAHGALLTGVDWRVDRIQDTKRAKALGVDVTIVTLTYREGGAERRVTLQVLPDMVEEVRAIGRLA